MLSSERRKTGFGFRQVEFMVLENYHFAYSTSDYDSMNNGTKKTGMKEVPGLRELSSGKTKQKQGNYAFRMVNAMSEVFTGYKLETLSKRLFTFLLSSWGQEPARTLPGQARVSCSVSFSCSVSKNPTSFFSQIWQ